MSEKKLYRVSVAFDFYAYAEDGEDAQFFARDALLDMSMGDCAASREVRPGHALAAGWGRHSLVYHEESGDLELGTLLDRARP
jgi:hypothetical protein